MSGPRRNRARKPKPVDRFATPIVLETFQELGSYDLSRLEQSYPSVGNGNVRVRRYRVTVERIDESVDVIHARLLKLWHASDNHHEWSPLRAEAAKYGLTLEIADVGRDRKRSQ
jgi:hypothetical protein